LAGKTPTRGRGRGDPVTIIIRRDEGEEPAHHGGAWKVAYADFVTAMMAFFLLMWLLNATTEEQRTGLADYFAPPNLFGRAASGSGQPFGGKTSNDAGTSVATSGSPQAIRGQQQPQVNTEDEEAETLSRLPTPMNDTDQAAEPHDGHPSQPDGQGATSVKDGSGKHALAQGGDYAAPRLTPAATPDPKAVSSEKTSAATAVRNDAVRERAALEQAGAQLMDAIRRDPALQDVAGQLTVETVPEALRIQVVDAEARQIFALGSAVPTLRVRNLMQKVVPVLAALPNALSIAGHTDSRSYRGQDKGNWELSADRANATRRILVDAGGLPDDRIRSVTGNADRDLLVSADPFNPANRRITIIVLRHTGNDPKGATTP
jgi:chemotaxis protein MotB